MAEAAQRVAMLSTHQKRLKKMLQLRSYVTETQALTQFEISTKAPDKCSDYHKAFEQMPRCGDSIIGMTTFTFTKYEHI